MTDEELRDTFHRVELRLERLDTKMDAFDKRLDAKIDALDKRLDAKIDALDKRLDTRLGAIETRVSTLERQNEGINDRVMQTYALLGDKASTNALAIWATIVMGWVGVVAAAAGLWLAR
jgi:chaperonin cofactor prefoldin